MSDRYRGRHRDRSLRGLLIVVLAGLSLVVALAATGAYGGYIAKITNNANSAATNPYFTCTAAQGGTTPQAYVTYPFGEAVGLTGATDISGNGRTGTYTGNVTTGVANNGAGAACPRDKRTVITLNGSTLLPLTNGYVYGPNSLVTNPNTFSVEVWFKTNAAQGRLIGFGGNRTGTSSVYDRQLYVNTNGKLVFGVFPNDYRTITSSASVNDGAWHHAVGTLSSAGMSLYLDGALVGTDPNTTVGQNFNGYWRVGFDNLATWPNAGSAYFFNGNVAFASVYTVPLTAAQVAQHYVAGD